MPARPIPEFKPGQSLRIQLSGSGERYSTAYSIVTAKKTPDLFITPMMIGRDVKISLHESGSWQVGLTSEGAVRFPDAKPRHWEIWKRNHGDLGPGITRAWYLLLADQELRTGLRDPKATALPPVGEGHAACVELLFVANEGDDIVIDDVHFVGRWLLEGNHECCLVAVRRIKWTAELQSLAKALRQEIAVMAEASKGTRPGPEHAYFVHRHDEQGVRFGIELAP